MFHIEGEKTVGGNLVTSGDFLYFADISGCFYAVSIKNKKIKWKIDLPGAVSASPVIHNKKLYLIVSNGVLYCIQARSGNIIWWRKIPSRSRFHMEMAENRILVTSFSDIMICFDSESGEQIGYYKSEEEIRSNPLWREPYVLINVYERTDQAGRLEFLEKSLRIKLESVKPSPQKSNTEIELKALAEGFFEPNFEFIVESKGKREVVQETSEKSSASWFPDSPGKYKIHVIVTDAREKKEETISYLISDFELPKRFKLKRFIAQITSLIIRIPWRI